MMEPLPYPAEDFTSVPSFDVLTPMMNNGTTITDQEVPNSDDGIFINNFSKALHLPCKYG